jgi:hypothetical protein
MSSSAPADAGVPNAALDDSPAMQTLRKWRMHLLDRLADAEGSDATARATPAVADDDSVAAAASPAAAAAAAAAAFLTDDVLRRYLTARGSPTAAVKALEATVAWRAGMSRECAGCAAAAGSGAPPPHCFLGLGFAAGGRPVVYGSVPRAQDYTPAAAVAHFVAVLETVLSVAPPGGAGDAPGPVGRGPAPEPAAAGLGLGLGPRPGARLVWLFDMTGFGVRHALLIRCALGYASTFSAHYPESLHAAVLLNPPPPVAAMLAAVAPLLDDRTRGKIRTVRGATPGALRDALAAEPGLGLPADVLAWVAAAAATAPVPGTLPPPPAGAAVMALPGLAVPAVESE